jgi:hypothetical protein
MFEGFTKIQSVAIRKFKTIYFPTDSEDGDRDRYNEEVTINSQLILKRELKVGYKGCVESTKIVEITFNFEEEISPSASLFIEANNGYEDEREDEKDEAITTFHLTAKLTIKLPKSELQEFLKYLNTDFYIYICGSLNNKADIKLEKPWLYIDIQGFEYAYLINQKQVNWYYDGLHSLASSYLRNLYIGNRGQISRIVNELSESSAKAGLILNEDEKDAEIVVELIKNLRSALRSNEANPSADYAYSNLWYLDAAELQAAIKALPDAEQKEIIEKYDELWTNIDISAAVNYGEDEYGAIAKGFDPKQDEIEDVAAMFLKLKTLRSKTLEQILINSLIYTETIAFARTVLAKEKFLRTFVPSKIIKSTDVVKEDMSYFKTVVKTFWDVSKLIFFDAVKIAATFAIAFVISNEDNLIAWIITTGYTVFRWWREAFIASLTPQDKKYVLLEKMNQVHKLSSKYHFDPSHLKNQLNEVSKEGAVFSPYIFTLLDLQIERQRKS